MFESPEVLDRVGVTLMLAADAGPNSDETLNVRNIGWWKCPASRTEHLLLVWVTAPADRAGSSLPITLNLVDADGAIALSEGSQGDIGATHVESEIAVPDDDELPAGHPIPCPPAVLAVRLVKPLKPGVYEWRCAVDGTTNHDWRRTFLVQDPAARRT